MSQPMSLKCASCGSWELQDKILPGQLVGTAWVCDACNERGRAPQAPAWSEHDEAQVRGALEHATEGRYQLQQLLGRGMGWVFSATRDEGARVALKTIRLPAGGEIESAKRFVREVDLLRQLDPHPHLVGYHEAGYADGVHWLAMDLVEGVDLQRRLAQVGPFPLREVGPLAMEILSALAHAHAARVEVQIVVDPGERDRQEFQGVVHRDLKPANVLLELAGGRPRRAVLTDLGLAKVHEAAGHTTITAEGGVGGTPQYWPREQARGDFRYLGPRSDVFSMGAVIYTCLTGVPPRPGLRGGHRLPPHKFLEVVLNDPIEPLGARVPDLPPIVLEVIQKALREEPRERFADAAAMREAWERALRASNLPVTWEEPTE